MISTGFGVALIIAAIAIAILFIKMIFIWRDVMLEQNDRRANDIKRLNEYKERKS